MTTFRRARPATTLVVLMTSICLSGVANGFNVPSSYRPRAAAFGRSSVSSSSSSDNEVEVRPSRPERKAAERERKKQVEDGTAYRQKLYGRKKKGRRNHNYEERNERLKSVKDETPYDLHSTAIPRLTTSSTADDVVRAVKRAQNYHDGHDLRNIEKFLLEEVDAGFAYGYRGSLLARLAVAALHMEEHDIARKAVDARRTEHRSSMLPLESAAILRGMLRVHNVTDALEVLEDELSLPLKGTDVSSEENVEKIVHRCLGICSMVSRFFYENDADTALNACDMLRAMGPVVREANVNVKDLDMPWPRLLQGAAQCEAQRRERPEKFENVDEQPVNLVYAVLDAMNTFPSDNDDRVYEILSNALVRRTCFVTGAVDVKGMPKEDRGEAVFLGRSNVGKSSLVNMVTNRKSLAYVGKKPGKTQQFNFFAVNDKVDLEREIKYGDEVDGTPDRDSFYVVDVPGFGFAKVPQQQRQEWADLMDEYLTTRRTVRVVFHLVDARHGPIDEDERVMKRIGEMSGDLSRRGVRYVVVLTKADKNVRNAGNKGQGAGKVSKDVMSALRETMQRCKVGKAPVILTSANTKLGRDDLWRYLKLAAER